MYVPDVVVVDTPRTGKPDKLLVFLNELVGIRMWHSISNGLGRAEGTPLKPTEEWVEKKRPKATDPAPMRQTSGLNVLQEKEDSPLAPEACQTRQ